LKNSFLISIDAEAVFYMRFPFSTCVTFPFLDSSVASLFRASGDLLPAISFSRFAPFRAWVIFHSQNRYIAMLFQSMRDLLSSMPFGRFASSRAWVIFLSRNRYIASLFKACVTFCPPCLPVAFNSHPKW
jgi:hypothetical protein